MRHSCTDKKGSNDIRWMNQHIQVGFCANILVLLWLLVGVFSRGFAAGSRPLAQSLLGTTAGNTV